MLRSTCLFFSISSTPTGKVIRQSGLKITVGTQTLDKCWDYWPNFTPDSVHTKMHKKNEWWNMVNIWSGHLIISQIMSDISVPKLWKAWFWMILASPKLLQDSQLCQQCLSIHPLRRACAWCCHMPQVSSPWPRSRASVDVAMVGRWNLGIHHGFFERKWRLPLLPLSSMNPWSKFEHL